MFTIRDSDFFLFITFVSFITILFWPKALLRKKLTFLHIHIFFIQELSQ